MTNGYTKLFGSLVTSSIWCEDDKTRLVWITMLALSNRDGLVEAAVPGLAAAARVTVEECRMALSKLQAPDPDSRSTEFEGRRVERVDGGFLILNHSKYGEMLSLEARREYNRQKQVEYRKKKQQATRELSIREVVRERSRAEDSLKEASPPYTTSNGTTILPAATQLVESIKLATV